MDTIQSFLKVPSSWCIIIILPENKNFSMKESFWCNKYSMTKQNPWTVLAINPSLLIHCIWSNHFQKYTHIGALPYRLVDGVLATCSRISGFPFCSAKFITHPKLVHFHLQIKEERQYITLFVDISLIHSCSQSTFWSASKVVLPSPS